jgi:hypothetical protein
MRKPTRWAHVAAAFALSGLGVAFGTGAIFWALSAPYRRARLEHLVANKELLLSVSSWKWSVIYLLTAMIFGGALWAILEVLGWPPSAGDGDGTPSAGSARAHRVGILGVGGALGVGLLWWTASSVFQQAYWDYMAGQRAAFSVTLWSEAAIVLVAVTLLAGALFASLAVRRLRCDVTEPVPKGTERVRSGPIGGAVVSQGSDQDGVRRSSPSRFFPNR